MKRLAILFIFFILSLFFLPIFAQSQEQGDAASQEESQDAVAKIKAKAQQVLEENTNLNNDNEALKRKQNDLEQQILFLNGEIEKAKKIVVRYEKRVEDIEKKRKRAEKYFDDFAWKLGVLEAERESLEKKIAYAQAQNLKEKEKEFSETSLAAEAKRKQLILKMENDLQYKINDLDTENKILNGQIAALSEKIAKAQKEKSFLESLLKQRKDGGPQVKVKKENLSAPPSQVFIPEKSAWKVPDILKE